MKLEQVTSFDIKGNFNIIIRKYSQVAKPNQYIVQFSKSTVTH